MIFGFVAAAQIPKEEITTDISIFPKEKVQLAVNSNMLLAGELFQYKSFILDAANKESKLSKIVYVSLRNENDSIVFSHKIKIENGSGSGDLFIPSSLQTGIYRLIGYTNFSRNSVENAYSQKNIYIINTFLKLEKSTQNSSDTLAFEKAQGFPTSEMLSSQSSKNLIKTDKSLYNQREKVSVTIENPSLKENGNYMLSVRKVNPLEVSKFDTKDVKSETSEIFYIPEVRGELISGIVVSASDNIPVSGKEVSLTIPGKDYIFKIAKTNSKGRFFFSIAEGYNSENSIIQLNEKQENAEKFKLVLDKKDFELGKNKFPIIKLDANLKDWLQERSVQLQIENAYFDVKKDSVFNENASPAFFNSMGTVFNLDDYTRFSTVKETFVEVVTLAAIRGSGATTKFIVNNVYDPNGTAKFNEIDPLVLMDGMQILNNEDLLNYNAKEIESVRVIIQPYRYGSKIFSGVIAIKTKKGDFMPTKKEGYIEEINIEPVAKRKQYYTPNYGNNASLSRIPDYRVQLLWNPNVKLNEKTYSTTFFTSDVSGVYEISFEGFSNEGEYISAKNYFTVSGD